MALRFLTLISFLFFASHASAAIVFSCISFDRTLRASGRQEDSGHVTYLRASVTPEAAKRNTRLSGRYFVALTQGDLEVFLPRGSVSSSGRHYFDGANYQDDTIVLDFTGSVGRLEAQIGGDLYLARMHCRVNQARSR